MPDVTPPAGFARAALDALARLDGLGLTVVGQRLEPDRAALASVGCRTGPVVPPLRL